MLFGVYFWSVIQDRCDRQVRTVGIMARPGDGEGGPSELIWIPLPSDFGTSDYSRRRAKALTKHLSAIAETKGELLRLFDSWLAPSASLREYLGAHRRESIETARKLIGSFHQLFSKTCLATWSCITGRTDQDGPTCWYVGEINGFWLKLNRGATN